METLTKDQKRENQHTEFLISIENRNYILAARIAESIGQPSGEIKDLQKKAIKQLIIEFRNPQGAIGLAEDYHFNKEEINQLLQEILKEAEEEGIIEKRQFDIKTMRYLTLTEWIKEYFSY